MHGILVGCMQIFAHVISQDFFQLLQATENGTSASGSSSKAATNEVDNKTNSTAPKKTYAIFDMAKRSKRARKDVDYAELIQLFRF